MAVNVLKPSLTTRKHSAACSIRANAAVTNNASKAHRCASLVIPIQLAGDRVRVARGAKTGEPPRLRLIVDRRRKTGPAAPSRVGGREDVDRVHLGVLDPVKEYLTTGRYVMVIFY